MTRLVNGLIPYFYPGEVTGTTYVDGKDIHKPMYGLKMYRLAMMESVTQLVM